jgi:hypothetical protein
MSRGHDLQELIIPQAHADLLWYVSWFSFASAVYAWNQGYYDLAIVPGGVWVTSINYWRKPDYSWRRYVDIGYVHTALLYQMLRAQESEHRRMYYTVLAMGCLFFPFGVYFHQNMHLRRSTLCHLLVHLLGNVSNVILYSGYVIPLSQSWMWRRSTSRGEKTMDIHA